MGESGINFNILRRIKGKKKGEEIDVSTPEAFRTSIQNAAEALRDEVKRNGRTLGDGPYAQKGFGLVPQAQDESGRLMRVVYSGSKLFDKLDMKLEQDTSGNELMFIHCMWNREPNQPEVFSLHFEGSNAGGIASSSSDPNVPVRFTSEQMESLKNCFSWVRATIRDTSDDFWKGIEEFSTEMTVD